MPVCLLSMSGFCVIKFKVAIIQFTNWYAGDIPEEWSLCRIITEKEKSGAASSVL